MLFFPCARFSDFLRVPANGGLQRDLDQVENTIRQLVAGKLKVQVDVGGRIEVLPARFEELVKYRDLITAALKAAEVAPAQRAGHMGFGRRLKGPNGKTC
ncbi:MAG: hypothetical protein WD688_22870 [Candidatus Binatia bacterium]